MELIDRYVHAVGRRLPRKQRRDVERELRSSLLDSLEGRSASPIEEEDAVRLLQEIGPPEKLAASYRPASQYLIGPDLFPAFKMVAGLVLTVLAALLAGAFVLSALVHPPELAGLSDQLSHLFLGFLRAALTALGAVVVVFAVLQRLELRPELPATEWNPRSLPALREADEIGRFEAIMGVSAPTILLIGINLYGDRLGESILPGGKALFGELLRANLPWLNASLLFAMAVGGQLLARGRWSWPLRGARVASDLFGIYVLYRTVSGLGGETGALAAAGVPLPAAEILVLGLRGGTAVLVLLVVAAAAKHLGPLVRRAGDLLG